MSDSTPGILQRIGYSVAVYALFFGGYTAVNRLIPLAGSADLTTAADRLIPFWPPAVYPFYLTYLLILAPALLLRSRDLLYRAALGFAVLVVASCLLFWLLPVAVPRPAFTPTTLAGELLARIYAADRPVCGFPSLHVSTAVLAALVLWRQRRLYGLLFMVPALLTAAATLLVKQHVLLDVAGGVVLALVVDRVVVSGLAGRVWRTRRRPAPTRDARRPT